ncbi:MAG TPA: class I SAM-dependent methyltransferase [Flavobacterium sp.]|nr:class I SAM-dependent methyltransferase [Flavobacterium sp.]
MAIKQKITNFLNKLPYIKGLFNHVSLFNKNSCYPAGHFYSPIISVDEIKRRQSEIWVKSDIEDIAGIDLQTAEQLDLLGHLSDYYNDMPFKAEKQPNLRYWFDNIYYSYTDAIFLYSMIRHFKPKRIIEIGSGFSSAVMLDTNELFFNSDIDMTFIEPYPQRLYSLLPDTDKKSTTIIEKDAQSVSINTFEKLEAGDILFVDSTHVSKTGSDVNYILFEILPVLKSGVLIHFHDIFYPFEYPKEWVFQGRNWNEDYIVKAFLMYNDKFKIRLFSEYLHKFHSDAFGKMPLAYKNFGGDLWIEKQ